jgi:hypothetical protein
MSDGLKFNICHIGTSHLLNDEVPELPSHIVHAITGALSYACRFWWLHLSEISHVDRDQYTLLLDIKTFLHDRFLYWLEVLSLIKEVPSAVKALDYVTEWAKVDFLPHIISNKV